MASVQLIKSNLNHTKMCRVRYSTDFYNFSANVGAIYRSFKIYVQSIGVSKLFRLQIISLFCYEQP